MLPSRLQVTLPSLLFRPSWMHLFTTAPFNDVVGTYTLRGFQVRVSKADGPPEGVWTKPEDFKSWLPVGHGPAVDSSKEGK